MLSLPFASGVALSRHLPAEEALVQAADLGCTHWYLDLNHELNAAKLWSRERVVRLREKAAGLAVQPILHGSLSNAIACETAIYRTGGLERVPREIDLAGQLQAPLVIHPSSYYPGRVEPPRREEALSSFVCSVLELENMAAEHGVELWLENLPARHRKRCYDSVFSSSDEYELVLANSTRSAMVFDVGHANVPAPPEGIILPAHGKKLAAICFSDNDGLEDRHLGLGSGSINFSLILDQLYTAAWRGIVAIETNSRDLASDVAYLGKHWDRMNHH